VINHNHLHLSDRLFFSFDLHQRALFIYELMHLCPPDSIQSIAAHKCLGPHLNCLQTAVNCDGYLGSLAWFWFVQFLFLLHRFNMLIYLSAYITYSVYSDLATQRETHYKLNRNRKKHANGTKEHSILDV